MVQGPMLLVILFVAIVFMIVLISRYKVHAFLALLLSAFFVGFAAGMNPVEVTQHVAKGFGGTVERIGIVIIAGTIIGVMLERSGAALTMAETILKLVGEKRPALAMSVIGYITSIPVFCDSGFVILSALNKSLAKRAGVSMAVMAVALSTGLYATHTLVPPTPGPIAAANNLKADLGMVIFIGLIVAIPAALAGYLWATWYSKRFNIEPDTSVSYEELLAKFKKLPSPLASFAPLVVPIVLIALKSVANFPGAPFGKGTLKVTFDFIGDPMIALLIGVGLCLFLVPKLDEEVLSGWVGQGIKDSAAIIMITAAGGSLGALIAATKIGNYLGQSLAQFNLGVFLPFIIAAAIKTAQGSSTVSLITTSTIVYPLLATLGLGSPMGAVLATMAIGCGSMVVSHANDSYFWVVSQFSNIPVDTAYKAQTLATLVMGITGMLTVWVMTWFLV
ncbi:Gluconate transporter [Thermosinus carboxydivorans Nor1]|uniref:Gluconate transporter n=1 Tax=Thermosinus carboxydivorans Nor1 TaxID=401526 RepID=A1HQ84_9FIRM|nr:GntP family permease [Thermosinus carboxydivorans]EAX47931.1 Gluconate transporter [Thermosinus carboxydivorans Nor1]